MHAAILAAVLILAGGQGSGRSQLQRIAPSSRSSALDRALPPVPGAVSASIRLFVGVAAGALWWLLVPGRLGYISPLAGLVVCWAAGRVPATPRPAEWRQLQREMPQTLEFLAAMLSSGKPLSAAIVMVGSISPPATRAFLQERAASSEIGMTADQNWGAVSPSHPWHPVAKDIRSSCESGAALVEAMKLHAQQARERSECEALVNAKKLGVKVTMPLMICFLPAFILVGVVPTAADLLADFFGK